MKAIPTTGTGSTNSCILRNAHWASNYNSSSPSSSPLTCANIVDQDITIRDLYLDGQKRNNASGQTNPRINSAGNTVTPVQFFGVTNLRMENVNVYDPTCFHVWVANINYSTFRNLRFCDPGYFGGTYTNPSPNTDGLHLNGPCDYILIDGLSGTTGDDFLPLNAADGHLFAYNNSVYFNYSVVYYGNITHLTAKGLAPYRSADAVRCLVGNDAGNGTPACIIDDCQITNVVGSVVQGGLQGSTFANAGSGGTQKRVTFRDWDLDILGIGGSNPPVGFQLGGNWTDCRISNVHHGDVQGSSIAHQVNVISGASVGRLMIENYWIKEDSSEASSPVAAVAVAGGTVDELILVNSGWNRYSGTSVPFASVTGGTVNRISLNGVSCNNLANLLSITGGTVTQVDTSNICHRNPYSSGVAVNVGTGVTVSNLTSCGSDTAALVGTPAGTITTKKTDSTERAS